MRVALVMVLVLLLFVSTGATVPRQVDTQLQDPIAPARIEITSSLQRARFRGDARSFYFLLWNKKISSKPIGHAYYACQYVGNGTMLCDAIFTLPYGRLVALGELHGFTRSTFVLVGGTTSERARREGKQGYQAAHGVVNAWKLGPGTYSLLFVMPR